MGGWSRVRLVLCAAVAHPSPARPTCVNIDDTKPFGWRLNAGPILNTHPPDGFFQVVDGLRQIHVYQFGVFQGDSMRELNQTLRPSVMWGLDSFEGLPPTEQANIWDWKPGAFSADPRRQSWPGDVRWIKGWYNLLADRLVAERGMKPAAYVDVDCDLYDSARSALDFMFRNRLIELRGRRGRS